MRQTSDAICLVMVPIIIELTRALKRNPVLPDREFVERVISVAERGKHGREN